MDSYCTLIKQDGTVFSTLDFRKGEGRGNSTWSSRNNNLLSFRTIQDMKTYAKANQMKVIRRFTFLNSKT